MDPSQVPPIISVDDHVLEPPDLWQRWLPSRFRERAPRVVRAPYEPLRPAAGDVPVLDQWPVRMSSEGPATDFWVYEDLVAPFLVAMASAGRAPSEIVMGPISYDEMRPGCWKVPERLVDMDVNHIERSLCFPSFPRFCGQVFLEADDKDLAAACVRAYNDWMVEEWCGDSGGRLIPLCLVPLWDPVLAAAEVRRNAARGARAVAFSELPSRLGLPSLHDAHGWWDPFLAACDETGTVVCMHVGSASETVRTAPDAPLSVDLALIGFNSQLALADWLLCGALARYPQLKLAFSESQVGWMPYMLERVDSIWAKGNAQSGLHPALVHAPSSYLDGRVFGCVFEDRFGLATGGGIGLGQITLESDYPHQDSTWPRTREMAAQLLDGLAPAEVDAVARGNAIRMLDLPLELS